MIEYIACICQLKVCVTILSQTHIPSALKIYSLDCFMNLKSCYTTDTVGVIGIEISSIRIILS